MPRETTPPFRLGDFLATLLIIPGVPLFVVVALWLSCKPAEWRCPKCGEPLTTAKVQ